MQKTHAEGQGNVMKIFDGPMSDGSERMRASDREYVAWELVCWPFSLGNYVLS